MSKNNPYIFELPKGYKLSSLTGGVNIIEYVGDLPPTIAPPKYHSSPLWKVLNNDKSEKTSELSQRRNRESEGYDTKIKESAKAIAKKYKDFKGRK